MTDGDRTQLDKFKKNQNTLWATEIELEKVLFIFQQAQLCKQASSTEETISKKKSKRGSNKLATPASEYSEFTFFNYS